MSESNEMRLGVIHTSDGIKLMMMSPITEIHQPTQYHTVVRLKACGNIQLLEVGLEISMEPPDEKGHQGGVPFWHHDNMETK